MKERLIVMVLLAFWVLFLAGCGGGGSSSTTAAGTVSGTVTLPANTNAKLFGKNATVSDYTTLTVSAGGATTKPDKDGKYSLSVAAGTNIEVTVTAPSGSVVLTAIVPSVTTGVTASQDVNTTTTAVALIYKQNTSLTISQISSSSSVTNVKDAIETALANPNNSTSITSNSTVTDSVKTAATPALSSVTLSPSSATVVSGATQTFTATGVDQFGSAISFTPTFSVSSSDLGTVTSSGVFTAAKTGTGTLTVTNGASISASATLTVTVGALNSLVISPTTATLYKGETLQFTVYGVDANGNTEKKKFITVSSPTWSVTGTIGSVDTNGLFTASAQGTGKVQAQTTKSDGTAVSITSDVTVSNRSPSISSGPTSSSSSITTAQTATISVTATDADSDTLSYSWSATSGAISGSGASVTYTPPSSAVTDTISVTVSDGNSGSETGSVSITVTAGGSVTLSITGITPSSGYTDIDTSVQISGTNFKSGATATIGGTALSSVTVSSSSTLTGTLSYGMTAGSYDVKVTNSDGQSATLSSGFTVNSPPAEWTKETLSFSGTNKPLTSTSTIILPDGATYRMYFTGPGGIWTTTSTDGKTWTSPTNTGATDTGATNPDVIILKDGSYLMIYGIQTNMPTTEILYRATSSDGITFIKQGVALQTDSTEDNFVSVPDLIYINSTTLRMYFVASTTTSRVHTATSTDNGATWTREGQISITGGAIGGQVNDPDIIQLSDGTYRLFFTTPPANQSIGDLRIRSATSTDGRTFTLESGSRLTPSGSVSAIMDPDTVLIIGTTDKYRLYYGANLSSNSPDDLRAIVSP